MRLPRSADSSIRLLEGNDGVYLPNGAAAKARLNRSILNASWGQFLGILADKAESAGRLVIPVDARNTSRTCPPSAGGCGHLSADNRPPGPPVAEPTGGACRSYAVTRTR